MSGRWFRMARSKFVPLQTICVFDKQEFQTGSFSQRFHAPCGIERGYAKKLHTCFLVPFVHGKIHDPAEPEGVFFTLSRSLPSFRRKSPEILFALAAVSHMKRQRSPLSTSHAFADRVKLFGLQIRWGPLFQSPSHQIGQAFRADGRCVITACRKNCAACRKSP